MRSCRAILNIDKIWVAVVAYPVVWLDTKEYAEVCSAIRTNNANKIPEEGYIFHSKHFYVYTHGRYSRKIIFELKIEIEGNEDYIDNFIRRFEK